MRIYKGSEITLRLYNPCKIEDGLVDVILYTTNPKLAYKVKDATVEGNIVYVKINKSTFNNMEDGVINYIILDEVYNTERQSSYYLKTPEDYVAKSVQTSKDIYIVDNGDYKVLPDEDYTSIEEVNVHVDVDTDTFYNSGYTDGFNIGYDEGIEYASENAGDVAAQTARVLDVTENGFYLTKYVEPIKIYPELITGDFGDGNYFYDWGEIVDGCYDTKIIPTPTTRIEFWWKKQGASFGDAWFPIFGTGYKSASELYIRDYNSSYKQLQFYAGSKDKIFEYDTEGWNHFIIEGGTLYVNGTEICSFDVSNVVYDSPILINSIPSNRGKRCMNGLFGMFKIDDNIFIPKDDSFINYNTGEKLGGYAFNNDKLYQYDFHTSESEITGVFEDNIEFHDYAELKGVWFKTPILAKTSSKLEFWYRNNKYDSQYSTIVGAQKSNFIFKICEASSKLMGVEYGYPGVNNYYQSFSFPYDNNWHHFILSKSDGMVLDGVKQFDLDKFSYNDVAPNFYINCAYLDEDTKNANGNIGMVKIDDNIFIPTEKGFMDYKTKKYLKTNFVFNPDDIPFVGTYIYTENEIVTIEAEGNLIKQVNVNVPPKLNMNPLQIKFGYSTFTKIPDNLIDWNTLTDANYLFAYCEKLSDLGEIDTSNVYNFTRTFYHCNSLRGDAIKNLNTSNGKTFSYMLAETGLDYFPSLDLGNAERIDYLFADNGNTLIEVMPINTSKVTNMNALFNNFSTVQKLQKLPEFDCTNVVNIGSYFAYSGYQDKVPNLTDCGGWKNLKCNWNDGYGLNHCPNLTYQSCINILNGLYDFTGNGETPTSNQGKLRVHSNFLTTVGDEVSIAVAKGWQISA